MLNCRELLKILQAIRKMKGEKTFELTFSNIYKRQRRKSKDNLIATLTFRKKKKDPIHDNSRSSLAEKVSREHRTDRPRS